MTVHLRDRRIIAFSRGDGSSRSRRRAAAHLERCPTCRARLGRMGAIRDAVRDTTAVEAPDRFDEVLARLDEGEVVLLPAAAPASARPRLPRRVAVVLAALALSAAAAAAAVAVFGPPDSSPASEAVPTPPAIRPPVAGLATPLTSDSFMIRIVPFSGRVTVRVGVTSTDAVEVRGVGAASSARFQAVRDGIHVSGFTGGELHLAVPVSAPRVLVHHADAALLEVVEGQFRIHATARLEGDSVVFVDVGQATGDGAEAAHSGGPR